MWFGDSEISSQLYVIADARPGRGSSRGRGCDRRRNRQTHRRGTDSGRARPGADKLTSRIWSRASRRSVDSEARRTCWPSTRRSSAIPGPSSGCSTCSARRARGVQRAAPSGWRRCLRAARPARSGYAPPRRERRRRGKLPEIGEAPPLDLPELQRAELSNGLEIVLAERHDVPVVRFKMPFRRLRRDLGGHPRPGEAGDGRAQRRHRDARRARAGRRTRAAGREPVVGADLDFSVSLETLTTRPSIRRSTSLQT